MTVEEMLDRLRRIAPYFQNRPGFSDDDLASVNEVIRIEVSPRDIGQTRHLWIAPCRIYHVLADSLAPSAETSFFLGLLTGAHLTFKLPSVGLPDFEAFARDVATDLGEPLELTHVWDPESWYAADTAVVFGNDQTIHHFRNLARPWQRLVTYGHKISAAVIAAEDAGNSFWAERAVIDLLAYRQTGCLSPQIHFLPHPDASRLWVQRLITCLRQREGELPDPSFEEAALLQTARDRCRLAGFPVHCGDRCRWTVVEVPADSWFVGPGYGFIQVTAAPDLPSVLESGRGKWSALGLSAGAWKEARRQQTALALLGFSRFCSIGRMQAPVLSWRHDGGARLATLGRWLSIENG